MRLFLDTANLEEIKTVAAWGVLGGVTTNPTLVAKEGADFHRRIRDIAAVADGPISAEVLATEAPEMVREAEILAALAPNVVIKVPIGEEGLTAAAELSRRGIPTNVTLIFSANQALLAALSGATYVSPFVGRLDDISQDGMAVVRETVEVFRQGGYPTQVIAASIRHPVHVLDAAKCGTHVATVPFKVIQTMMRHPLTDLGIKRFLADWDNAKGSLGGVK